MTRVIFATVGALAFLAFDHSQAVSVEAPWCAVTKEGDHGIVGIIRLRSVNFDQMMSALPPIADIRGQSKCPLSANSGHICHSFDYLVGARQLRGASRPRTNRETAL